MKAKLSVERCKVSRPFMRYIVAMKVDEVTIVIKHLNRGHDDDMIDIYLSFVNLVHFKEIRAWLTSTNSSYLKK
jgi:hypothetical protein